MVSYEFVQTVNNLFVNVINRYNQKYNNESIFENGFKLSDDIDEYNEEKSELTRMKSQNQNDIDYRYTCFQDKLIKHNMSALKKLIKDNNENVSNLSYIKSEITKYANYDLELENILSTM